MSRPSASTGGTGSATTDLAGSVDVGVGLYAVR